MAFYEREFKVGVNDVSSDGVCTKKSILAFFETAACEYCDSVGYGILTMNQTKKSWVLLNWKVEFIKYPAYGQTVKVKTWMRDTFACSCYRDFILYDSQGVIYAKGTTKWAFIDIYKGLCRLSEQVIAACAPETDCVFNCKKLDKLALPDNLNYVFDYIVKKSDIDVNMHMHNLNYLSIAEDALSNCDVNEYDTLEIFYKNQSKLGELLCVLKTETQNEKTVAINGNGTLKAVVKVYNTRSFI